MYVCARVCARIRARGYRLPDRGSSAPPIAVAAAPAESPEGALQRAPRRHQAEAA